jgi:hypothetical protein
MTKEELNETLKKISGQAAVQGGKITRDDVSSYFSGDNFSDQQVDMICDFLLSKGIIVEGYVKKTAEQPSGEEAVKWSDEEQRWLDGYMEDLKAVRPEKEGEWDRLKEELSGANAAAAKRRLAEIFLPDVVELSKQMYEPGMLLQDLVQEGSLQLVLYTDTLEIPAGDSREDVRTKLLAEVRAGMQMMIERHRDVHARDQKLVKKASDFRDGVEILKEEYGRKVYLDEAADFMNMTEEEAEDILRLTGDQVPDDDGQDSEKPEGPDPDKG